MEFANELYPNASHFTRIALTEMEFNRMIQRGETIETTTARGGITISPTANSSSTGTTTNTKEEKDSLLIF